MRLFVALWPPPDAVAELADRVQAVRAGPDALPGADAVRWADPQAWHLTLAFLGELGDERLPDLHQRLARAAARHPAPALRLAGAGRFGERILFTRVEGDREPLRHLAGSVNAAVRRCGLPVDPRPYRGHLTLGRGRPGADLRPFVAALADFGGRSWTPADLHLVRSRLGAGPDRSSRYETVGVWPLTGSRRRTA